MPAEKTMLILLLLTLVAAGLSLAACDAFCDCEDCEDCDCDDDAAGDDDTSGDDDDDNQYNDCGDINQECLDWYLGCWGEEYATPGQEFCTIYVTMLNQYWDGNDPCVKNAQCEFFGCLQVNVTDCISQDQADLQANVDACWMVYEATANAC